MCLAGRAIAGVTPAVRHYAVATQQCVASYSAVLTSISTLSFPSAVVRLATFIFVICG